MTASAARPRSVTPRGDLWALLALAVAVRALAAALTAVPGRDGVTYLWMAERVAAGEYAQAWSTVFHPLYGQLVGVLLAGLPALDPVVAGQVVSAGCGAFAVMPLYSLAHARFGGAAALAAALLYAFGTYFVRPTADCMSEGPFLLAVAVWAWLLVGTRTADDPALQPPLPTVVRSLLAGVVVGLAYGLRPEALAMAGATGIWLLARAAGDGRRAVSVRVALFVAGAAGPVAVVLVGFARVHGAFVWTPKSAFNWEQGAGGAGTDAVAHYVEHLGRSVGTAFEAVGIVAMLGALWGLARLRAWRPSTTAFLLVLPFVAQFLVVPLLRSHVRFFVGFGILLLPFAGVAWARVAPALAARARWLPWLLAALALGPDLVRLPQARRADRTVLRQLGQHLRPTLQPGDRVATEMPRLEYFLGLRPGEPRPIPRDEILAVAADPATRYVIVVAGRSGLTAADVAPLGFRPVPLPADLAAAAAERGLVVTRRQ